MFLRWLQDKTSLIVHMCCEMFLNGTKTIVLNKMERKRFMKHALLVAKRWTICCIKPNKKYSLRNVISFSYGLMITSNDLSQQTFQLICKIRRATGNCRGQSLTVKWRYFQVLPWGWILLGGSGGMVPQKILQIEQLRPAKIDFPTPKTRHNSWVFTQCLPGRIQIFI